MSKKIRTNNNDLTVSTGIALVVRVGSFKFVKEQSYPWIDIFMIGNENDELLEQKDLEKVDEIVDITDLKIFALNWVFDNVEIVKDIEEEIAPEVPAQEQLGKDKNNELLALIITANSLINKVIKLIKNDISE